MRYRYFLFLILTLLLVHPGCGGGGPSDSGSSTTRVEIVLGETKTGSQETGTILKETDQIPPGVVTMRFTISSPDMETIQRSVPVVEKTTITEAFEVPVGPSRRFLIEALDSAGNVAFQGDVYATVGVTPLTLTITMVSTVPMLSNPVYSLVGLNNYVDPAGGLPYSTYNIGFDYSDINGDANVEAGATLRLQAQFIGGYYYDNDMTHVLSGINGYSGSVRFDVHIRWDITTRVVETITLTDGGGNISNAIEITIDRPEGAN
jgi:hypothetical protein